MTPAQQTELFDWPTYLAKTGAIAAPPEAFCQNTTLPLNPFRLGQKVEIDSPDIEDAVHLGSIVYLHGPRISVRFDGCDALNDVFLCVDSAELSPVGSRKHLWAPPLRYSKDISKYRANCDRLLKNLPAEMIAPPEVFLKPPKGNKKNLFQVGQKLEAVDLKQPWSICVATIKNVDLNNVEIHLDGWEKSSDYICSYNSRNLFPVGWCEKAGYRIVGPGPRAEYSNDIPVKAPPAQDSRTKPISPVNSVPPLIVSVPRSKPSSDSAKSSANQSVSPKGKSEVIVTAKKSPPSKSTIVKPLQNGTSTKVIASKSTPPESAVQSTVQSSLIVPILKISTAIQTVKATKSSTKSLSGSKRKLNQEFDNNHLSNSKQVKTPLISQNPISSIQNNTDKTGATANSTVNGKVNSDLPTKIVNNKLQQQNNTASSLASVSAVAIEEWDYLEVVNFLLKNDQFKGLGLAPNLKQHKIDGKALLILSVKTMTSEMGISLGRALKFRHFIDKIISNSK